MADIPYEDILTKFAGNEIDSKEFLNLLLTSDESGIEYLQNLKKEFKEKYVLPVFKGAKDLYSKMDTEINKASKKENLDALSDPLDIIKLNKEYKEKTKKLFEKKLKELDSSIDVDETQTQKTLASRVGDFVAKILPENTQNVAQEQGTFTPKEETISLSEKTIKDIGELLKLNLKDIEENTAKKQMIEEEAGGGILSTIGKLLALGGVASILISAYWEDYIKPWLEKKFDVNLDFLDKFEGLVDGIAKFFTLGGLKVAGGPLFALVGKAFTSFGDLLEGGLKAIFKLGFGDEVIEAGAKAAPATWKTILPKVVGSIFKGPGKLILKGIPILGSLISFYFAYDRFQQGETIQGIVELVAGVASLIPGVGIPLSIGLSALNAFIDYKVGDLPQDQQQAAAAGIIGNIGSKIYDMLKDIPFVGGLLKFGLGIYELASGNYDKALEYLTEQPFLGPFPALVKSLLDARVDQADGTKTFSFEAFQKELKTNMFKWMISMIPNAWGLRGGIAKIMGLEYNDTTGNITVSNDPANLQSLTEQQVAKNNEIKQRTSAEYGTIQELSISADKQQKLKNGIDKLTKEIEIAKKEYEEATSFWAAIQGTVNPFYDAIGTEYDAKEKLERLESELAIMKGSYGEALYKQKEMMQYSDESGNLDGSRVATQLKRKLQFSPEVKDDFEFNADFSRAVLFDNKNKTANIMSPDDNLLAYKTDGVFDKSLKQMTALMDSINRGIYKMSTTLETNQTMTSPSINIASQANQQSYKDVILSGSRDSIYDLRNNWWRTTASIREIA